MQKNQATFFKTDEKVLQSLEKLETIQKESKVTQARLQKILDDTRDKYEKGEVQLTPTLHGILTNTSNELKEINKTIEENDKIFAQYEYKPKF